MTQDELNDYVWRQLPARKHLLGRKRTDELVRRCVRSWPIAVLRQCDYDEAQVVGIYMERSLKRYADAEFGMGIILTIVLGALISELVKILLRWWLENDTHKRIMTELHR